jgi:MFS superfamily sulfate permease-like transporter
MSDGKNRLASPSHPWLADLFASVVVFLVALPLCLAIAQASGLPPETGIITGIIGGIIVGSVAGSPLQVSGPAAGLIVIILNIVQKHGVPVLFAGIFIAGLLQFVGGFLRWGRLFRAVSPAVIHGMLAGIGIVIIAKQFHVLVDDVPGNATVIQNIMSMPEAVAKAFSDDDKDQPHHRMAAIVGIISILVLVLWKPLVPKKLKMIPGVLVAVVVAAVVGDWLDHDIKTIQVQSNLFACITWLPSLDWRVFLNGATWQAAATIGIIASAESLLCAVAVDRMHTGPRTNFNRELSAQGVGNILCGVVGALPMTGVIVRSAANVEAGARTRLSTILHGCWLLGFVTLFPHILERIPLTCLAAILIVTGYRLIDLPGMRHLWHVSRSESAIFVITAATIVATDLLVGVATGVGLAMLKLVWTFSHLKISTYHDADQRKTVMRLNGAATFLSLPKLADYLDAVPPATELHLEFEHLTYIDHACLELIMNWEKQHEADGSSLNLDWESLQARFRSPRTTTPDTLDGNPDAVPVIDRNGELVRDQRQATPA